MYAYSNPCPASGLPAPPPRKGVGGTRAEPLLYTHPYDLLNEAFQIDAGDWTLDWLSQASDTTRRRGLGLSPLGHGVETRHIPDGVWIVHGRKLCAGIPKGKHQKGNPRATQELKSWSPKHMCHMFLSCNVHLKRLIFNIPFSWRSRGQLSSPTRQ